MVPIVGDSTWDTNLKLVACPVHAKSRVLVDMKVDQRIRALAGMVSTEVVAYLLGDKLDQTYHVRGIEVPEQTATVVSVDDVAPSVSKNVLGTVHTHPGNKGGAFFSQQDASNILRNFPLNLLVSGTGYKAHIREKLECGRWSSDEAEVSVCCPGVEEAREWAEKEVGKVQSLVVTPWGLGALDLEGLV